MCVAYNAFITSGPVQAPECIEHCHSICQQEIGMKFEQKTKKQKQANKKHLKGFI